jgi:hypothetical protein
MILKKNISLRYFPKIEIHSFPYLNNKLKINQDLIIFFFPLKFQTIKKIYFLFIFFHLNIILTIISNYKVP